MTDQDVFQSAQALPRAAAPVQLSYPPDLNGEMLRWLAKDENMAQVAGISKRVVVLAPDILASIQGQLHSGMPEDELAKYVEKSTAYSWYQRDVELPASPQTLIDLAKSAAAHGVELYAISGGPYNFIDTDKAIARENGVTGEQVVSTAFNAAINPVLALAKYVVAAADANDSIKKSVTNGVNLRTDQTMQLLSGLRAEEGLTPEVILYPERKYDKMQDLSAQYETAFGTKLTVLPMPLKEEAKIDLQRLHQLQGADLQPDADPAGKPPAKPSVKPQSSTSLTGWGNS